jgi:hypothetical protein
MLFRSKLDKGLFSEPPDLNMCFHLRERVLHEECTHSIESLSTLEKLLTEKRLKKEDPVLRFLVDLSGIAWFARETRPDISAPKHFQMTGEAQSHAQCRTAGNIKFKNASCKVLKNINHRSGDFHPSFYSLRLFLAILILNEELLPFKLPRILVIKEQNKEGNIIYKHRYRVSRIKNWVNTFRGNEKLVNQLKEQAVDTKIVHYKSTINESKNRINPIKKQEIETKLVHENATVHDLAY